MLENQARRQAQNRNDKEVESTLGKWSQAVSLLFDFTFVPEISVIHLIVMFSFPFRGHYSRALTSICSVSWCPFVGNQIETL